MTTFELYLVPALAVLGAFATAMYVRATDPVRREERQRADEARRR